MDAVSLTRRLVDIESISGNERAVGEYLLEYLTGLGYSASRMEVAPNRFNVYATIPGRKPTVVFSTHMDTVPPFIPSSEDGDYIYGRGSCDASGSSVCVVATSRGSSRPAVACRTSSI